MKVKDLIALLSKYDPEVDVITANDGEDYEDEQLTECFITTYSSHPDYKGVYYKYQDILPTGIQHPRIYRNYTYGDKVVELYLVLNPKTLNFKELGVFNDKVQVSEDTTST